MGEVCQQCEQLISDNIDRDKNCNHVFCKKCTLIYFIQCRDSSDQPQQCPDESCKEIIPQQKIYEINQELKSLLKHFQGFEKQIFSQAKRKCPSEDCEGFFEAGIKLNELFCPKCRLIECLNCAVSHVNLSCMGFQEKLRSENQVPLSAEDKVHTFNQQDDSNLLMQSESSLKGDYIVMQRCSHRFCRQSFVSHCLKSSKRFVELRCLATECTNTFDEKEIRDMLGDDYNEYSFRVMQLVRASETKNKMKPASMTGNEDPTNRASGAIPKVRSYGPQHKVETSRSFNCFVCRKQIVDPTSIRRCSHSFCRQCLSDHCMFSAKKYVEVRCPAKNCRDTMDEDEIVKLLDKKSYEEYYEKTSQRLNGKVMPRNEASNEKPEEQPQKPNDDLMSFTDVPVKPAEVQTSADEPMCTESD